VCVCSHQGARHKGKNKEKKDRLDGMEKIYDWVAVQKKEARFGDWSSKEIDYVNDLHLLTSKPALHLINLSQEDFLRKKNKWLAKIKEWVEANRPGEKMVLYSAAMEQKLVDMDEDARKKFLEENQTKSQMGTLRGPLDLPLLMASRWPL
jgi:obg-like ATPase 1